MNDDVLSLVSALSEVLKGGGVFFKEVKRGSSSAQVYLPKELVGRKTAVLVFPEENE